MNQSHAKTHAEITKLIINGFLDGTSSLARGFMPTIRILNDAIEFEITVMVHGVRVAGSHTTVGVSDNPGEFGYKAGRQAADDLIAEVQKQLSRKAA